MSALGDALDTKGREFVLKCKITIAVDSLTTAETPTYSLLLEAPETSETLLEELTIEGLTDAITELTDWVTASW